MFHFTEYVKEVSEMTTLWIGANDLTKDQCWTWVDENYFFFSKWSTGRLVLCLNEDISFFCVIFDFGFSSAMLMGRGVVYSA